MAAITLARLSDVTSAILAAHGCRVKRASTNFSIGNNTLTAVQFDAEDYDTDSMHDNVTNNSRLTIPSLTGVTTGLWGMKASGYGSGVSSQRVDCEFRLNGTTPIAFSTQPQTSDSLVGWALAADYVFTAADYVECLIRTPAGTGAVVYDVGISPIFEIAFLGKVT